MQVRSGISLSSTPQPLVFEYLFWLVVDSLSPKQSAELKYHSPTHFSFMSILESNQKGAVVLFVRQLLLFARHGRALTGEKGSCVGSQGW